MQPKSNLNTITLPSSLPNASLPPMVSQSWEIRHLGHDMGDTSPSSTDSPHTSPSVLPSWSHCRKTPTTPSWYKATTPQIFLQLYYDTGPSRCDVALAGNTHPSPSPTTAPTSSHSTRHPLVSRKQFETRLSRVQVETRLPCKQATRRVCTILGLLFPAPPWSACFHWFSLLAHEWNPTPADHLWNHKPHRPSSFRQCVLPRPHRRPVTSVTVTRSYAANDSPARDY